MPPPPSILLLLLLLLLSSPQASAEVKTTKNGKPFTLESTVGMGAVFTPGEEHCGELYYLNVTMGCVVANPPFSAAFNASFGSLNASLTTLVPFFFFGAAEAVGCTSYAQVFEQLFPVLETLPSSDRPSVFVAGSTIMIDIGNAAEPFGELDYEALPYRFVSLPFIDGINVATHAVSPQVCVIVKHGYFSNHFIGIGHYFTQVILGIIHVICLGVASYEAIISVKKQHWLRAIMFASAAIFPLMSFIGFCWDDKNYFNQMGNTTSWFLGWTGMAGHFMTTFALLYMWLTVIKTGSLSSHVHPYLSRFSTVIIFLNWFIAILSCIIGGVSSTNPSLFSLLVVTNIFFIVLSILVVIFFASFGFMVLSLIRGALLEGRNRLIFKITMAMIICTLSQVGTTICGILGYYHMATMTPFPGGRAFAMFICWEVLPTITILAIIISFSSLPFVGNSWFSSKSNSAVTSTEMKSNRSSQVAAKARAHEEKELDFASPV